MQVAGRSEDHGVRVTVRGCTRTKFNSEGPPRGYNLEQVMHEVPCQLRRRAPAFDRLGEYSYGSRRLRRKNYIFIAANRVLWVNNASVAATKVHFVTLYRWMEDSVKQCNIGNAM